MASTPLPSATTTTTTLSAELAASLHPQLVHLTSLASASPAHESDHEARLNKLEVGKHATKLRTTLATLKAQVGHLPSGNLSLEDQEWLIEKLEKELEGRTRDVAHLATLIPGAGEQDKMETD
ncbi:hypothetical protein MNV49_004419 [Pseudohyphozyma bogoriensis]|nr:hypothetical protein MNV49_004419 [Pseudohyphozyma bogoriensis]